MKQNKKIRITEKQAKTLGLKTTCEDEDSGVKSFKTTSADKIIRIAVSGLTVPKFKDRIVQLIMRQDPEAKVNYFEATGKIVGTAKEVRLQSIQRDIKLLDPSISVEESNPSKKLIKITKEQYNRVFAEKTLTEGDIAGGLDRVDKTFKKTFSGKNVQSLKPVAEDKFNVTKPNKSVPKLPKGVGHAKPPITEDNDEIKKESLELLKYLYRKTDKLSPFWEKNGLTYDKICDALLSDGIIIKKDGAYELSKHIGSPQAAMHALEGKLASLVPTVTNEPQVDLKDEPVEPSLETPKASDSANMEETSNYPAGTENDPTAPWNQEEPDVREPKIPKNPQLQVLCTNYDISILKGLDGALYCFHFAFKDKEEFAEYAPVTRHYVGKDEDGKPEYKYDTDFEIDNNVISNYVNDNLATLSKGEGLAAWNEGIDLVKIDEPVKHEILSVFDKDKNVVKAFGGINEVDAIDKFKSGIKKNFTPPTESSTEDPEAKQSRIVKKLQDLKAKEAGRVEKEKTDNKKSWETGDVDETTNPETMAKPISDAQAIQFDDEDRSWWSDRYKEVNGFRPTNMSNKEIIEWANDNFILRGKEVIYKDEFKDIDEMTGAASSGAFTGVLSTPVIKREMPDVPVVGETTTATGAGKFQYDTNALQGIDRDGTFKETKKTKAEKTPQWAGGSFVKMGDCTKPNNNKVAQNGGCNVGAGDAVSYKKGHGSVNAPSLAEGIELTPPQAERLKRINNATLKGIIRRLNELRATPETVEPEFKLSKWWKYLEYINGVWEAKVEDTGKVLSQIGVNLNENIMREALKLQHDKANNRLIVLSDLEGKAASQETFKNKNVLKQNGFIWTGTNWAIPSDKLEVAKKTLSIVNKAEYIINTLEDVEEAVMESNSDNKSLLKAKLDQYISDLANATDEAALSAEIRRYLTFFSKFHHYSFNNKILIYIQKPDSTRVASYRTWQSKYRQVKKGAKAITILAPIVNKVKGAEVKDDSDVETRPQDIRGFKAVSVFDISDTEAIDERGNAPETPKWFGDNTPNETAEKLFVAISEVASDMGIKITQTDSKRGEKGYSAGDHINLTSDVQGVSKLSTMIHEIAHELMHWKSSSIYYQGDETKYNAAIKELQAESVSYVVLKHYGIPVSHHTTYLALWKANKEKIQKNLEVISKVAEFIIKKIDEEVARGVKSVEQPAIEQN